MRIKIPVTPVIQVLTVGPYFFLRYVIKSAAIDCMSVSSARCHHSLEADHAAAAAAARCSPVSRYAAPVSATFIRLTRLAGLWADIKYDFCLSSLDDFSVIYYRLF